MAIQIFYTLTTGMLTACITSDLYVVIWGLTCLPGLSLQGLHYSCIHNGMLRVARPFESRTL